MRPPGFAGEVLPAECLGYNMRVETAAFQGPCQQRWVTGPPYPSPVRMTKFHSGTDRSPSPAAGQVLSPAISAFDLKVEDDNDT